VVENYSQKESKFLLKVKKSELKLFFGVSEFDIINQEAEKLLDTKILKSEKIRINYNQSKLIISMKIIEINKFQCLRCY
jgi:hypothetical protein